MPSHKGFWSVFTLIVISLIISSVSAAPTVVNEALGSISQDTVYPNTAGSLEDLNTMLESIDYNDLHQLPPDAEVKDIPLDTVKWGISLEELATNTSTYPDGNYSVSGSKENQLPIIATLQTLTLDSGESARRIEIGVITSDGGAEGVLRSEIPFSPILVVGLVTVVIIGTYNLISSFYASSQTSQYFPLMTRHTIYKDGYYYLSHRIYDGTLYDYLECEAPLLAENPGATIVVNFKGHGWVSNNEVIAQSYSYKLDDKSQVLIYEGKGAFVYADKESIGSALSEHRELKWMGVHLPNGSFENPWYDVVWGALYIFPRD